LNNLKISHITKEYKKEKVRGVEGGCLENEIYKKKKKDSYNIKLNTIIERVYF
jgi:hypothetical protein